MSNIPAHHIVATKNADGSTTFQLYIGALTGGQKQLVFQWLMPSADTTSLNTNVFGGTTGATRTFAYAQTTAGAQEGFNHWFSSV